jgi:Rrf2 family protein
MRLPQTAEYALRAMTYLATLPLDSAVSSRELAERTGIPSAYLSKVMRKLVVAKLADSKKGHGGGFRLAWSPDQILLREVMDAVDYDLDPDRCAFGWEECDPKKPCPLHPAWSEMKMTFNSWADTTSLKAAAEIRRTSGRRDRG